MSDIQLTVTPEEVVDYFDDFQTQLQIITLGFGVLLSIPGQSLVAGLEGAIELNDDLYDALRGSTSNPTLLALFDALQRSVDSGATSVLDAVAIIGGNSLASLRDITDLVTGTLTGSLSNVLAAVVAVTNDPEDFANYTGLLGAGVATGELIVNNGLQIVQEVGNAGFLIVDTGIRTVQDQINNAIQTVRDLIDVGAGIPGSEFLSAVVDGVQEIVIGTVQAAVDIPFDLTADALGTVETGFNRVIDDTQDLVTSIATDLQTAIGANPLDRTAETVDGVAQIPSSVASSVTGDTNAGVATDRTRDLAAASTEVRNAPGNSESTVDKIEGDSAAVVGVSDATERDTLGPLQPTAEGRSTDDETTDGDDATVDRAVVSEGADSDASKAERDSKRADLDPDSGSVADTGTESE